MRMAKSKTSAELKPKLKFIEVYQASTLPSFCWKNTDVHVQCIPKYLTWYEPNLFNTCKETCYTATSNDKHAN